MKRRVRRVFLGLTEVSGFYRNLKDGFEEIGVPCLYVDQSAHRFGYGGESRGWTVSFLHWTANTYRRFGKNRLAAFVLRLAQGLARALILAQAIVTCDAFVFGYLSTFFRYRELPLLKLFGKYVIFVLHGSDSRARYLDGYQQSGVTMEALAESTRAQKEQILTAERWADAMVCTPIHTHLHSRPVIGYQSLGAPIQYDETSAPAVERRGGTRIVHAPSAPEHKGTYRIREAIERLRGEGFAIEFVEMIGRPHAEVVAELHACDFVVDQLNGEGPIGGFATEAAYFGKPAVVGTHTEDIWIMYGPGELPPIVRCDNDTLEDSIRRLIVDPEYRHDVGARAREFVRTRWRPAEVARRYLQLIAGNAPPEWTFDPADLRYIYGAGLTLPKLRDVLAEYIRVNGDGALHLDDKPALKQRVLAFAAGQEV